MESDAENWGMCEGQGRSLSFEFGVNTLRNLGHFAISFFWVFIGCPLDQTGHTVDERNPAPL